MWVCSRRITISGPAWLAPMQLGDVPVTYADTKVLGEDFGYRPSITLREGLRKFAE